MTRPNDTAAMQRLGLRLPVVLGPFGGGLSSTSLTAQVSNHGGLGSFGAHHLPPDDVARIVRELGTLTSQRYAVNLWVSDHDTGGDRLDADTFERAWPIFEPYYRELGVARPALPERVHHRFDEQVEALLVARPPAFSFVFGVPSAAVLQACRQRDIVTLGAATSIAEARALEEAGVDMIVASGFEAGGHRPSFLARAEDALMGTFVLTQLIATRVRAPVISAGGIADARGIRAAQALGAQAAQIGTAFLACEESGTTDVHRAALFSTAAEQTTLTRTFTGRLARGLRNRWTDELQRRVPELPPFPITGWFVAQLRQAALVSGHSELVSLWSGQVAPNLVHRRASDLLDAIERDLQTTA